MKQPSSQFRHTLLYSLYTGGAIIMYLLILYIFGMTNNPRLLNIAGFIFMIGVYISVKHYRDKVNEGVISFGRAYGTAMLTCVFAGIIWAVYGYILHKYLSPGLLTEKIEEAQELWLKRGMSEELVELQSSLITPFIMALGYIFSAAFWGSVLSLPLAAILRRENNPLVDKQDKE
jgi:hypothetical protein